MLSRLITVAVLAVATVGSLATDAALARKLRPYAQPNSHPTVQERMGNQPVDPTVSGTRMNLANPFPGTRANGPATALLLTDGSVLMIDICTRTGAG